MLPNRELKIAEILRPLGTGPLSRQMAMRAAQLLNIHWTSVYRLRRRFLAHPVTSSLKAKDPGPREGQRHLDPAVEGIIDAVLQDWLPQQSDLGRRLRDIDQEIRRRCIKKRLEPPSRFSVARRWDAHQTMQAEALADNPKALKAPGEFKVDAPLQVVQIDHTLADVMVVDGLTRRVARRPWISVALDVATRCVVGISVSFDRPSAATVALLVTRVAFSKESLMKALDLNAQWPMHGIPESLHLDNAAEFRGRALKGGCAEYGIKLIYRPVGRPQFGGHIERVIRTLMERLKGLPGATGQSTKPRRGKAPIKPEANAALTLREFERWVVLEIAQRYHHSKHRGLIGGTPAQAWAQHISRYPPRVLDQTPEAGLRFMVYFLPIDHRTVQNDGLTIFYIRYWHPIFTTWRALQRQVIVRYHPDDLSRIFVSANGKAYYEARYADLRRPSITLSEHRAVCKLIRSSNERHVSESLIFQAIEDQRDLVRQAVAKTRQSRHKPPHAKRRRQHGLHPDDRGSHLPSDQPAQVSPPEVDYSKDPIPYPVEIW